MKVLNKSKTLTKLKLSKLTKRKLTKLKLLCYFISYLIWNKGKMCAKLNHFLYIYISLI